MKKLIFLYFKFFGSGHFLVHFLDIMDQKMAQTKNIWEGKNLLFHASQLFIYFFIRFK